MSLKEKIDATRLPRHVAVIMDGNGRWAKQQGKPRVFGHGHGVTSVREVTEACAELGVEFLTLYAFSTENWSRPEAEVTALMTLLVQTIRKEISTLNKNNIRLRAIGDVTRLPDACFKELMEAIDETRQNTRMTLILALNYSARWELLRVAQRIAADVASTKLLPEQVTEAVFESYLSTTNFPDPDLLIRTSGETRISNFLLWQIAYTELYFTPTLWPDFRKEHLYEAIIDFQSRERRFGQTGEQVK